MSKSIKRPPEDDSRHRRAVGRAEGREIPEEVNLLPGIPTAIVQCDFLGATTYRPVLASK